MRCVQRKWVVLRSQDVYVCRYSVASSSVRVDDVGGVGG